MLDVKFSHIVLRSDKKLSVIVFAQKLLRIAQGKKPRPEGGGRRKDQSSGDELIFHSLFFFKVTQLIHSSFSPAFWLSFLSAVHP